VTNLVVELYNETQDTEVRPETHMERTLASAKYTGLHLHACHSRRYNVMLSPISPSLQKLQCRSCRGHAALKISVTRREVGHSIVTTP